MSLRVNEAERVSLPLSLMQTQEAPILSLIALLFFFFSVYYNLPHPSGVMHKLNVGQDRLDFVEHQVANHWQRTAFKAVK